MMTEAFRAYARAWLLEHAPPSLLGTRQGRFSGFWGGRNGTGTDDQLRWRDVMLEQGWTAPTWPTEYGGAGLGPEEGKILEELMIELGLPPAVVGFGVSMIGPTLLDYGTQEQKARHLPPVVRGEIRWCQGYSEPGAGSDLASLRTRCVPSESGDELIIDGSKIWTSYANFSDWIFCLVRTNPEAPKREGITFILVDMDQPGVKTKEIKLLSGASSFCEVFFDQARARTDDVVGELNAGWPIAKALLGYERASIGAAIGDQLKTAEDELVDAARRYLHAPEGPLPDALLRDEIARQAMDDRAFELTVDRVEQERRAAGRPGPEASVLKVLGSELKQRRHELALRVAGHNGIGWEGAGYDEVELQRVRDWLRSRANTIEGGTTEIQLNILATRILGLPR